MAPNKEKYKDGGKEQPKNQIDLTYIRRSIDQPLKNTLNLTSQRVRWLLTLVVVQVFIHWLWLIV